MWEAERGGAAAPGGGGGGVALISAGVPAPGGRSGLPVVPSPRQGRHDGVRGAGGRRGQAAGATAPGVGVMTCTTSRRPAQGRRWSCGLRRWGVVEGADVVVA